MVFYKTFKPKVLFLRKYPNKETEETDHVVLDTLNTDITDKAPDRQEITKFDIFCILFSMITYVADILSDILISLLHYFNNRKLFAILIGIFVIVPSIILNFISFYWWKIDFQQKKKKLQKNEINIIDNSKRCLKINLLLSLFQLGPLSWYYKALKAAINVYKDKDNVLIDKKTKEIKFYKMIEADRDSSLLRFFEAILESLPQTLVQGYFILDQVVNKDFEMSFLIMMQILSIILSLISACTSLTIQHRALRISRDDKNNMLIMESIFQGLWRFLTLLSRYVVIILYAYYLQKWFWILIIIHLALSASHIFSLQSLETGDNSRYIDFILLVINTMIHIFLPFNMAEGSTLWRYIIGYLIEFVEYLVSYTL
uniref:XK-related protein n=1 Tax=Parastrongyloides trichosuri TaxID=131310 RepID=A0A0N4ZCH8_PARTI